MPTTFPFRCPRTGRRVQGYTADEVRHDQKIVQVSCDACGSVHFVDPKQDSRDATK